MSEESGYDLVIRFPDQSASFTYGFEAGTIWQQLKNNVPNLSTVVRIENKLLYQDMAQYNGYTLVSGDSGTDGWQNVTFTKEIKPILTLVKNDY